MQETSATEVAREAAPQSADRDSSAVRRWRILILPAAAVLLLAVCVYKTTRDYSRPAGGAVPAVLRTAPAFTLLDSQSPQEMVRLETWLGRHAILLVFYAGRQGVAADPRIEQVRLRADEIDRAGAKVFGISTALPQQNRAAMSARRQQDPAYNIPFPVLTDLPPAMAVHRLWGTVDPAGDPVPAVFVIDRAGRVPWQDGHPVPAGDVTEAINRLLAGG